MKKQFALALVFAGLVMNTSVRADEAVAPTEPVEAAQTEQAPVTDADSASKGGEKPKEASFASKAVDYVFAKKDAVVKKAHAHPYIASATAGVAVLAALVWKSSGFRRLIGMETEEDDLQKKYHPKFGL